MRFGYSWMRNAVNALPKQVVVGLGLLTLPIAACLENLADATPLPPSPPHLSPVIEPSAQRQDPRAVRLRRYFSRLHCPIKDLAEEFIRAADKNHLDWRLLPSISVVESGGGKSFRNNNIFGWNNGSQPFSSVRSGIQVVAARLGRSPLYRNRDVAGKLHVYNPSEGYVQNVLAVMHRISPDVTRPTPSLIFENN